ncbi:AAA family ATPase [Aquipuribacter sp. MA13-6]|uniref:AAA family ATPase n=1 Tax=unclassified Aquipuribacter TaxID=2635084 RepID=UPI003EE9930D
MTRVIIGAADQALAREIQSSLLEMDDVELAYVAATTTELAQAVLREDADIVLVHDLLGPDPVLALVRDLGIRRPATASLLVSGSADADTVTAAMEVGARGMVSLPLSFAQLQGRLTAAGEWSAQIRRMISAGPASSGFDESAGRARIVGFAGSKGGVGVTTLLTHISLDIARTVPSLAVCLIDLDLEKGDVPGLVEVRHRIGVADLAKVADDLSAGTVADAMSRHESGVDLLLAPTDIRDVEAVTPQTFRQVLAAIRQEYDLVLLDLGSHVTPVQATALELCDEVVLVTNPDVASMRGMRRTFNAWESLGVFKETDVRVLLNRASKQVTVSLDTVRQLTRASVLDTTVPAAFRRLEPAINARNPLEVRNPQWWNDLRRVGREISLVPQTVTPSTRRRDGTRTSPPGRTAPTDEGSSARAGARQRPGRKRRKTADTGSASLEMTAMIPIFALIALLVWHVAVLGYASVLQSAASNVAAREYAITASASQAQDAARDRLPFYEPGNITVQVSGGQVRTSVEVPDVAGTFLPGMPTTITSTRQVVTEP